MTKANGAIRHSHSPPYLSPNSRSIPLPPLRPLQTVQSAIPSYQEARDLVLHEVKDFFKPEFLNRLDDVPL